MDPATGLGLALAVYKDVYHLAKSVYRIATSAQHYKAEQADLVEDFRSELLYLCGFHKIFVANRAGRLVGDKILDSALSNEIYKIVRKIHKLFSEYQSLALEEDEQYRQWYLGTAKDVSTTEDSFPFEDLMLTPSGQNAQDDSAKSSMDRLGEWFKLAKNQPLYRLSAWKWALFNKTKLAHLIDKFHVYNQRLKDLVPLFLSSQYTSNHDLANFEKELKSSEEADYTPFTRHIRIRKALDNDEDETYELGHSLDIACRSDTAEGAESQRIWTEYKSYEVPAVNKDTTDRNGTSRPLRAESELQESIHRLARLLFEAGSYDLHTLPFSGYKHEVASRRFAFLFDYPVDVAASKPQTLNHLIKDLTTSEKPFLSDRFKIAMTVTKALSAFHADGWLHKSMSSDAILFFKDVALRIQYSNPYLVGFEFSRRESDETYNTFDSDPKKNLYRHPDRQGPPTVHFNRMHDAFALGVVLLEIGLWCTATDLQIKMLRSLRKRLGEDAVLTPEGLRKGYLDFARQQLPHQMGYHYLEAVTTCLSDELTEHLDQDTFGTTFLTSVTSKVDAKRLLH